LVNKQKDTVMKTLREYIDIINESNQVQEAGILNALGQVGGAIGGTAANAANAVGDAAKGAYNAVGNAVGGAVDAVKAAGNDVAQGAKAGYAAATGAPAAGAAAKPAAKPGAAAKPAAAAGGQPEAWVKELQTKLNAAGEKLKVDGIMGPGTRAAQARHPEVTTQPADAQAVAKDMLSANDGSAVSGAAAAPRNPNAGLAPAAPAAPAAAPSPWANDPAKDAAWKALSPEDQKWLGKADPTDTIILSRAPNKGKPAAPATAPAAAPAAAPAVANESAYDEVQRLVNLVHYR